MLRTMSPSNGEARFVRMIHEHFCRNRRSSFVKRVSHLANKDEQHALSVLRAPRTVWERDSRARSFKQFRHELCELAPDMKQRQPRFHSSLGEDRLVHLNGRERFDGFFPYDLHAILRQDYS